MQFIVYLSLFFSALLSGLSVFVFKTGNENRLKLLLAFSGSYLFAISVLHLIPEIYASGKGAEIGIYILIGFFLQVLLEFFSGGIEHGHIHTHEGKTTSFPTFILISLGIHAFFEGMPLANKEGFNEEMSTLLTGIILHKMPIAFVLMSLLVQVNITRWIAVFILAVFALMTPLGLFVGSTLGIAHFDTDIIIALVVGIFLHVSTTILFESSADHRFNLYKFIIIIFGASLAFINM